MKWSADKIKILKELKSKGVTHNEIAKKLNTTEDSVKMKVCKLGKLGEIKLRRLIYDDTFTFNYADEKTLLQNLIIYVCEGTSYNPDRDKNRVEIVNSDPRIIYSFIKFLRKLRVNEEKIKLRLKCSKNEENHLKKFWSNLLKIPYSSFGISSKPIGNSKRKNQFGTLTVKYNSKKLAYELYKRINKVLNLNS